MTQVTSVGSVQGRILDSPGNDTFRDLAWPGSGKILDRTNGFGKKCDEVLEYQLNLYSFIMILSDSFMV